MRQLGPKPEGRRRGERGRSMRNNDLDHLERVSSHPSKWRRVKVFRSVLEDAIDTLRDASAHIMSGDAETDPFTEDDGRDIKEAADFLECLRDHKYDVFLKDLSSEKEDPQ